MSKKSKHSDYTWENKPTKKFIADMFALARRTSESLEEIKPEDRAAANRAHVETCDVVWVFWREPGGDTDDAEVWHCRCVKGEGHSGVGLTGAKFVECEAEAEAISKYCAHVESLYRPMARATLMSGTPTLH